MYCLEYLFGFLRVSEHILNGLLFQLLMECGADVNMPYSSLNTTPLMTSAYHGHYDIIRFLLQGGADVHAEDIQGSNAIGYAFGGKLTEILYKQFNTSTTPSPLGEVRINFNLRISTHSLEKYCSID